MRHYHIKSLFQIQSFKITNNKCGNESEKSIEKKSQKRKKKQKNKKTKKIKKQKNKKKCKHLQNYSQ